MTEFQIANINSLKSRIKDPDHLIAKIIRKSIEDKQRKITLKNYEIEMTDLIGIRVIHLFKEEWSDIDKLFGEKWNFHGKPIINLRDGDDKNFYKDIPPNKMHTNEHKHGYRSVHYIIKENYNDKNYFIEIQVRTIFEEAWAEIDHAIVYPNQLENKVLKKYSKIINRISGAADEMASFMLNEVNELSELDKLKQENERLKQENEVMKKKMTIVENNNVEFTKRMKDLQNDLSEQEIVYFNNQFRKQQQDTLRNPNSNSNSIIEILKQKKKDIEKINKINKIIKNKSSLFKHNIEIVEELLKQQNQIPDLVPPNPLSSVTKINKAISDQLEQTKAEFKISLFDDKMRERHLEVRRINELLKKKKK